MLEGGSHYVDPRPKVELLKWGLKFQSFSTYPKH